MLVGPKTFPIPSILLLLLAAALPVECVSSVSRTWLRGFDNLSDYEEAAILSATAVKHCLATASEAAHLVTFSKSDGACREFRCRLQLPNCRLCRSTSVGGAVTANLTEVWTPKPYADHCWITVQHRVSDSVDFNRNWTEYKAGFGEGPAGNFWIGLESLHSLTSSANQQLKLRILMKAWNSTEVWVEYTYFKVGPESTNYQLNLSSVYSSSESGNWNSMPPSSGRGFSTMDINNDLCGNRAFNCAAVYKGGWWFNCCSDAYPNGLYFYSPAALSSPSWKGVVWLNRFGSTYSLMEFEMLVA